MSKQFIDKDLAKRIANRIYSLIIAYNQPITAEKDKNLAKLETELANIGFDVGTNNGSSDQIHYTANLSDLDELDENKEPILDKDGNPITLENISKKFDDLADAMTKTINNIPNNDEFDKKIKRIISENISDRNLLHEDERRDLASLHDLIYNRNVTEEHVAGVINDLNKLVECVDKLDKRVKNVEARNDIEDSAGVNFKVFKGYEKINDGFELHYSEFKVPRRKHPTDTGWDGYVCFPDEYDKEKTIYPGKTEVIPLGIIIDIPKGYEIQVRPRSGLSSKGIYVAFGSVDESYRGVIKATVYNSTKEPFVVKQRDRICQLVPARKANEVIDLVEAADNDYYDETDRGANGFGSTGI